MQKLEISHKTIIFTVSLLIGLWLIYQIRLILLLWFISFILMTALHPVVLALQQLKMPRILAIIITFVLTIAGISLIIAGIIPPFIDQTVYLAKNIDQFSFELPFFRFDSDVLREQIGTISENALNLVGIVAGAFSNLFTVFSLFVLTFYLLLERQNFKHFLKVLFSNDNREQDAEILIHSIEHRLGGWVRGEIALMIIVGVLSYIGLRLLGVPFAIPLALLAGLLELVPNIGPTISAIPAVIIGFTISPAIALGVIILYLAVQQLENHVIVPMVMKQSVGLNPMITLMALMVGLTLGGVLGAVLAVPLFITIEVVLRFYYEYRSRSKRKPAD